MEQEPTLGFFYARINVHMDQSNFQCSTSSIFRVTCRKMRIQSILREGQNVLTFPVQHRFVDRMHIRHNNDGDDGGIISSTKANKNEWITGACVFVLRFERDRFLMPLRATKTRH